MRLVQVVFPFLIGIKGRVDTYLTRVKGYANGVFIGSNCDIRNSSFGRYSAVAYNAQISDSVVGERSSIGRYSKLRTVQMGKYCSISWDVTIGAAPHSLSGITTHIFWNLPQFGVTKDLQKPLEDEEPVTIGNDVWIGCGAIIKSGVSIGNGAVIGANSFVNADVPPYAIVAGSPARIIRYRFNPEVIHRLEEIAWWDWDDALLTSNLVLFSNQDVHFESANDVDRFFASQSDLKETSNILRKE